MPKKQKSPPSSREAIAIPFINTSPIVDIGLLYLLLPIWWAIGIEQIIWPVGLVLIGLRVFSNLNFKIKLVPTTKWLFWFIIVHLLSGLFIVESFRWLTFARNLSTYVLAFLLVLILTNRIKSHGEIDYLLRRLIFVMTIASLVGLLGIFGIWRPNFQSLLGSFLPDWIVKTTYGGAIAFKETGQEDWFAGLGKYYRVNSFFNFATMYASALAISVPIALYHINRSRGLRAKFFWFFSLIVMVSNLLFTTGRVAIISLGLGATYFLFRYSESKKNVRALTAVVAFLAVFASLVMSLREGNIPPSFYEENINRVVFSRGQGSFVSRERVYRQTLKGVMERPVLGWGTERDFPKSRFPAGSHSYYLGILYKQGFIGLLIFMGIWFSLWRGTKPSKLNRSADPSNRSKLMLMHYARFVIMAAMINSLTDSLDLDATTMAVMWLIFALAISSHHIGSQEGKEARVGARSC
ncbi:O-antigen ligase family protein [Acidobacteriota bacterium]